MTQQALSPLKQAFLALQEAQGRIAKLESKMEAGRADPVALIGVGCRIPGAADGPEGYWALLRDATTAVSDKTMLRWRDFGIEPRLDAGDSSARWGALLDAPDRFDPQFFGISPREAANMDPQQRLLLEVSWEALEDAAIAPDSTYGSRTGVYFGISSNDFAQIELADSEHGNINPHLASGGALSVAAGRVSYTLGWHGPAISLDTACSSSLVAVHLACEGIRSGDCDMALAGGVNLILSPVSSIAFARSGMLSSVGRVDAFGLGADGFVRGEGCGVVVLKRLSLARRDGDRVLAVIAGSAVNHDGPGSGLTVPNGQAQAALLRSALHSAGLAPADIGYVEAHGTGTRLGDPIEAEALGAVFGAGARERPLAIGSVKTNLGHLEAAAGIAGLIKVVLALEHGEIPAQLHGDPPSEFVRWSDLPLQVVRERRRWEPIGGRRIAGVSAFGFSGTNAHVIVEEAPAGELRGQESRPAEGLEVLALSAKSAASLKMLTERYAEFLEKHPGQNWEDVCYTAAVGRTHFKHRLAVVASSGAEASALLRDAAAQAGPGAVLRSGLQDFARHERQSGQTGLRQTESGKTESGKTESGKTAHDRADAYRNGAELPWAAWHGGPARRRVRLPGYAFERERHWLPGPRNRPPAGQTDTIRGDTIGGDATGHALLGARLRLAGEGTRYQWRARPGRELSWLNEHRIAGQAILPATAYLEMLLAAGERLPGSGPARVEDLTLIAPLHLLEDGSADRVVQVAVDPAGAPDENRRRVRVFSSNQGGNNQGGNKQGSNEPGGSEPGSATSADSEWRLHGEGHVSRAATAALPAKTHSPDPEAVRKRCPEAIEAPAFYARMEAAGADFGPRFQRVRRVFRGDGEVLGEVGIETPAAAFGYRLHPACLDACLQAAAALLPKMKTAPAGDAPKWLPARLEGFEYHPASSTALKPDEAVCLVHATLLPSSTTHRAHVSFALYLPSHPQPFATLQKITFEKQRKSASRNTIEDWFYSPTWKESPRINEIRTASRDWIIASQGKPSEQSLANCMAGALRSMGQQVVLWDLNMPHSQPGTARPPMGSNIAGVLYVHEPLAGGSDSPESFTLRSKPAVEGLLDVSRIIRQSKSTPRLYVLTCHAHAITQGVGPIYPLEAIVSGLAATASAEYEELHCVRIDIDATDSISSASPVADEILSDSTDDWIAFRNGVRYLPRLERVPPRESGAALQLAWTPGQGANSLRQERLDRRSLEYGEVEIEVRSAGLNFHDVLSVLDVLDDTSPLGSECSGVISRLGPGVTQHKVGADVVAVASGALATRVVAAQDLVFLKPAALSFEQAASLPIAYLTASYCLLEKGGLDTGEAAGKRVLIHAATGGVGLAAVHLCQRYSAKIFATAGSETKRAYLRSLGIPHVMDSRSAAFAEEIANATDGRGVDIVLNCLAGELTDAGLSATASSGNFVDIGATDIRDPDEVASKYPGVRYHTVDLAAALDSDREGMRRRLGDLIKELGSGLLPTLPVECFELKNAAAAFRHMAAARHIGKIALASNAPPVERTAPIVPGGSYIVTGSMTGLGLEVSQWLAARGAGRIVVGGRRAPSLQADAIFERLRETGTEVVVVQGDIADSRVVTRTVEAAGAEVRGILHCAGAVDDAPLAEQTWDTFSNALQAKAEGAWLLHEQTRSLPNARPLDFFVLFSSWASIAGSPGAANYCAANAFLDALAQHRHAMGLAATSIDWGPWARIGMTAGRSEESFAERGLTPMPTEAAIQALELALYDQSQAQIAIADVDWVRVAVSPNRRRNVPAVYRRMEEFRAATAENLHGHRSISKPPMSSARADWRDPRAIPSQVRRLVLDVLELPPHAEIDPSQPLHELGLDSILAVELAGSISSLLGRPLSSGFVFDYPTLASLIAHVTETTVAASAKASYKSDTRKARSENPDAPILDRLEELTDEEVEQLLRDKAFAG